MKKKYIRRISLVIMGVLLIVMVGYALSINRADDEALEALDVDYELISGTYHVKANNALAEVVFYPGALVEPEAYLPLAEKLAKQGFNVYIPKMPLHLAILDSGAVEKIGIDDTKPVYIGGHSLGGVAALNHVDEHREDFDGLFLIASYPQPSVDLSEWERPVLSITASNDGVMDVANYNEALERLPDHTIQYEIYGANHSNFGNYGKQRLDEDADITRSSQQTLTANRIGSMILNNLE
ncbi:MAG: alpha/beta hydrolase [Bacillota bacterium]